LLSDEFLEEVREMPQRNLAVELLEKLLNDGIHARSGNNVVQQKKYSDRLKAVLLKYNNRAIETAQVIEELIQMAKAFQEAMARDDALGLTPDEIAFYDALAENESAVRELGDDTLRKLAIEVTLKLRQSTTVDWQVRESVRARLRILVRQTLRKYKYPPDKTPGAVELILKQAEVVSNSWTVALLNNKISCERPCSWLDVQAILHAFWHPSLCHPVQRRTMACFRYLTIVVTQRQ
jgi:type I restriction enzyme R subunit